MKKRKKKFSGGNFKQYKNKSNEDKRDVGKEDNVSLNQIENEKEEFPLILIIVDGFVEFCEETYQRYDDSLYLILREGEKLGIKVMISIESFSGMYISATLFCMRPSAGNGRYPQTAKCSRSVPEKIVSRCAAVLLSLRKPACGYRNRILSELQKASFFCCRRTIAFCISWGCAEIHVPV